MLLLQACGLKGGPPNQDRGKGDAITWGTFGSYSAHKEFLDLVQETYPEIELEFESYDGGNRTGYSWAQMRADDIPDIFITSQVLDRELVKERLVDLSGYAFVNDFSTVYLNQMEIDGGIYLLPVSYSMYGIYYNRTLMEEKGWEVPGNFAELEALCGEIREEGMIPGILGTQLPANTFSVMFNMANTGWRTTPEGVRWEREFLKGDASAREMWEPTMDYVQKYIDMGMFTVDPEDRSATTLIKDYLGGRKAVFFTGVQTVPSRVITPESADELSLMPYLGDTGTKNIYMYNPFCYFGISKRLTEPGNEEKLENALKILNLLFSPEGQEVLTDSSFPNTLSALSGDIVHEDAMVYDAQQALWDGRAFPMTYAGWDAVLFDMGQAFKDWFRGENGMDGKNCMASMDLFMETYLDGGDAYYFCESTADFTLEETGRLVGKALGSASGADGAMISLGGFHEGGIENRYGVNGRLYGGKINEDVKNTICPAYDGEYAILTMTGAQAKELAQAGFDWAGDGQPFPYVLVLRGNREPEDEALYRIAFSMGGYTEEMAERYDGEVRKGSLRDILRNYLEDEKTVSPEGNPWE